MGAGRECTLTTTRGIAGNVRSICSQHHEPCAGIHHKHVAALLVHTQTLMPVL